jgi:hypothetical protein
LARLDQAHRVGRDADPAQDWRTSSPPPAALLNQTNWSEGFELHEFRYLATNPAGMMTSLNPIDRNLFEKRCFKTRWI